ncbi:hypothetical protein KTO58_20750 [Chitinophaga pendula]|uniref:hypothetical protein n=1 Tax=Chitinophaga TaxID=79328 RepID=UPI000BAEFDF4|nr:MULTISPECIES: hypothetical protein [Chitinophaga]ASZ10931.1 hypothetical protein CK934_08055 [Chitinophaga sp. MD30]UCJ06081.1 hypothetical protein KTO58_20750 [Chitinophaga pendula]
MDNYLLSEQEWEVAASADFIYRKNSVMNKVILLLGQVQQELASTILPPDITLPAVCAQQSPKISKGEKYQELPYVILDYPRYFSQDAIFAFRTMFWWGHYFSCTLHLGGTIKEHYLPALLAGKEQLCEMEIYVYNQEDPWLHDFENGNYQPISSISTKEWQNIISHRSFVKLAKPFSLNTWENIIPEAAKVYTTFLKVLGPGG